VFAEDDDAFDLWRRIAGLPEERIIRIPTSDNFWAMGDTGPCGPCSEIFYDHGAISPAGRRARPRPTATASSRSGTSCSCSSSR
jgi:alanyl-tRNA synthetase